MTARVAVNRVWQAIFGEGLVETPEDFGTRSPVPEQRELLDWLAVDFMEHGWSQKHLIKTIVTSATYQQSSAVSPALLERDPRNRLLARGPRFRADAEVVRDIALSASGLITHKLGGPGIIPPVPQNVLDYNYTYPSYWTPAQGPDRYRRTLYVFRKRSMPDPGAVELRRAQRRLFVRASHAFQHAAGSLDWPQRDDLHGSGAGDGAANLARRWSR